jgi:hypothetical protein
VCRWRFPEARARTILLVFARRRCGARLASITDCAVFDFHSRAANDGEVDVTEYTASRREVHARRPASSRHASERRHAGSLRGVHALCALLCAAGVALLGPLRAHALDTDVFAGTTVKPNVLIIFDNSGSMGSQAYNTYPNTIYSGRRTPGPSTRAARTRTASRAAT